MKAPTTRTPAITPKKRCAIYTRKSTDEGLDQEYNSLEAQRDSALAFITSQRHEGWIAIDDGYDDGGFSGGNTNRPSLKRLLADVEDGLARTEGNGRAEHYGSHAPNERGVGKPVPHRAEPDYAVADRASPTA